MRWQDNPVAAYVSVHRRMVSEGKSDQQAASAIAAKYPAMVAEVLDIIGSFPSSETELRALQRNRSGGSRNPLDTTWEIAAKDRRKTIMAIYKATNVSDKMLRNKKHTVMLVGQPARNFGVDNYYSLTLEDLSNAELYRLAYAMELFGSQKNRSGGIAWDPVPPNVGAYQRRAIEIMVNEYGMSPDQASQRLDRKTTKTWMRKAFKAHQPVSLFVSDVAKIDESRRNRAGKKGSAKAEEKTMSVRGFTYTLVPVSSLGYSGASLLISKASKKGDVDGYLVKDGSNRPLAYLSGGDFTSDDVWYLSRLVGAAKPGVYGASSSSMMFDSIDKAIDHAGTHFKHI